MGVFFGCEEAKEAYRRGSVARISDLVGGGGKKEEPTTKGRMLVVEVKMEDGVERVVWDGGLKGRKRVEATLVARSRSAFAEELFSVVGLALLGYPRRVSLISLTSRSCRTRCGRTPRSRQD